MELIDLNGMYQWDNTIFDNMVIPSDINRNDLIDMLILDCRELTISIVSPSILKRAIELWSKKNIYYWNELQKTMHYEYNPIENYDRHEVTTDNYSSDNTSNENGVRTTRQTGTNTTTETGTRTKVDSGSKTTTDELDVSAFNSSTLEPREKHTITETPTDYTTTETPNITTENTPDLISIENPNVTVKDNNKGMNKHESRIRGNVGVTTSQQMILSQREVVDISLYNVIINSFKNEFCLLKY